MYRIPLDDYNSNSDVKFNTCSSTRNCNQPKFNFPTDRASRAMSGRSSNVKNQFDIMCFLMGVELERLNQENEKLKHHNLDIKENAYENKNYEFYSTNISYENKSDNQSQIAYQKMHLLHDLNFHIDFSSQLNVLKNVLFSQELQLKDLSERLVKKELKCQELENQLTDANKMIAQKEILVQNQYNKIIIHPYLYQQINQQLQVIQQLQYTIKQLECKLGFLVCENENLSSKRNEELINIQHVWFN